MPIYEYECPKCGRFDALQKMSDSPLKTHDVCGSKVRKVMSAAGFAFKGSGFYITDYNGRNAAAITGRSEKKEKEKEKKSEGSSAPKSEACATCPKNKTAA